MSDNVVGKSDDDSVDDLLAKEFHKLSVHDRTAIQEEMHGVRSLAVPETPELLSKALEEFQRTIDKMGNLSTKRKVYNMILKRREEEIERNRELSDGGKDTASPGAESTSTISKKHYAIDDDNFRLRFLRVELFSIQKAVDRFLSYLELTHEFCGDIILDRPIYLSDIVTNKKERTYLKKGHHQILPFRDRSGRKVALDLGPIIKNDQEYMNIMFKIMFYVNDVATRDCVDTQRMGMVSCFETHSWESTSTTLATRRLCSRVMESVPVRYVAMHMCMPESRMLQNFRKTILQWGFRALSAQLPQLRLITTLGTEMECRYRLKSYGIPTELYPLTLTGNFKLNHHQQWMKTRLLLEDKDEARRTNKRYRSDEDDLEKEDIIECPCLNDVTFRRGTSSLINPGNVSFRALMLNYFEEQSRRIEDGINISTDSQGKSTETIASMSHEDSGKRKFCEVLIDEIDINRKGRFLVWNQSLSTWTRIRADNKKSRHKLRQKVMIALYNCEKLLSTIGNGKIQPIHRTPTRNDMNPEDRQNNYQFVGAGERAHSPVGDCGCFSDCSSDSSNPNKRYKQDR